MEAAARQALRGVSTIPTRTTGRRNEAPRGKAEEGPEIRKAEPATSPEATDSACSSNQKITLVLTLSQQLTEAKRRLREYPHVRAIHPQTRP
jgi:hypothetical protein